MDYRYVLEGHQDRVTAFVCFKKDKSHCMISVSWDQSVIVWDLNREMSHMKAQIQEAHTDCINHSVANHELPILAAHGLQLNGDTICLLFLDILDVDYSPELNQFATCGVDTKIILWDFDKLEKIMTLTGHTSEITKVS